MFRLYDPIHMYTVFCFMHCMDNFVLVKYHHPTLARPSSPICAYGDLKAYLSIYMRMQETFTCSTISLQATMAWLHKHS